MEDVIEGFFRFLWRLIVGIVFDVVFELIIKGPGVVILKIISKDQYSETVEVLVSLLFWGVAGLVAYLLFIP